MFSPWKIYMSVAAIYFWPFKYRYVCIQKFIQCKVLKYLMPACTEMYIIMSLPPMKIKIQFSVFNGHFWS